MQPPMARGGLDIRCAAQVGLLHLPVASARRCPLPRCEDSIAMTTDPLADVVSGQYEKWVYPEPIRDLPAWLAGNWQWFDPSHAHRLFWPDRDYRPDLEILIAGCGTNQAAVFAYTNPGASVVAIDVSAASLDHHRFLKDKYGLKNLELHRLPIEDVGSLARHYDLVVSTGVLHHMASPEAGMRALAKCLRPEGVAAIMLYARYGRIGVEMLQGVFRDLGLAQDEPSLAVVKAAIASLPQDHPLRSYMAVAPDLKFDAGLVDTFLHGRDRSYTVADCLDLAASAGLVFQDWFLKSAYEPAAVAEDPFVMAVAALPKEQRWAVMERINHRNGCHFFTACRPERPEGTYRVDMTSDGWLDAAPLFRYRCGLDGEKIFRPGWSTPLTAEQMALVRLVDGRRTIREIVAAAAQATTAPVRSPADLERFARNLFTSLVNRDFLLLGLPVCG
jgi:SAM-dependent methyltransferase